MLPNSNNRDKTPVEFSIVFVEASLLIEYSLALDLGLFFQPPKSIKIVKEVLKVNDTLVYSRTDMLEIGNVNSLAGLLIDKFDNNTSWIFDLAKKNMIENELFLTNGFKAMFSPKLVGIMQSWFSDKFNINYKINLASLSSITTARARRIEEIVDSLNLLNNHIRFEATSNNEMRLFSIIEDVTIFAEEIESEGTLKFITLINMVLDAVDNGSTLVIDEFDTSLDIASLLSVVTVFHNDEINTKGAQLFFCTHNPIFLNHNLLRRDEIKFVDRDDKTKSSILYSLSDFESSEVKKDPNYMTDYLMDKYGAVRDVDLTVAFLK